MSWPTVYEVGGERVFYIRLQRQVLKLQSQSRRCLLFLAKTFMLMNLEYPISGCNKYHRIQVLKCRDNVVVVVGWNATEDQYAALIFHKNIVIQPTDALRNIMIEIGPFENYQQCTKQLQKKIGPLHIKQKAIGYGIIGFRRFLQGYYMMYIREIEPVAKLGAHEINEIKETQIVPLFDLRSDGDSRNQRKYLEILLEFRLDNFYYSCTYDLTNPISNNMLRSTTGSEYLKNENKVNYTESPYSQQPNIEGYCEVFHSNYNMINKLHEAVDNKKWLVAAIHGYAKQINCKLKGTIFNIIVIARRSRHHMGTRYIKRGINSDGFVANFVEVEQIVINYSLSQNRRPMCSSFLQVRGSVPVYWMQRPSIAIPKPPIQINESDYLYLSTRKHFHDMVSRYGQLIYCVNLMKIKQKQPRQRELSREYQNSIKFINKNDLGIKKHIHYIEMDMKYNLKLDKKLFINKIRTLAYYSTLRTGLFICMNHSTSLNQQFIQFQNGTIRGNCVDCLDRTNSFQQLIGETVLAMQLSILLKQDIKLENLTLDEKILEQYSDLYGQMGDLISIQYGSSLAHKQKIQKNSQSWFSKITTAVQRHLNNNFKDQNRQRQIDLFLGYQPNGTPQLWDLKPTIEHYPSPSLRSFEHHPWFPQAQQYYLNNHHIPFFMEHAQRSTPLVNMEYIGKEYLRRKFNADIVNNLATDKDSCKIYRFCIRLKQVPQPQPKLPAKKLTLQQHLRLNYNRMEYLKEDDSKQVRRKRNKVEKQPDLKTTKQIFSKLEQIVDNAHLEEDQLSFEDVSLKTYDENLEHIEEYNTPEIDVHNDIFVQSRKAALQVQSEIQGVNSMFQNHNYLLFLLKKQIEMKKKEQKDEKGQNKHDKHQKGCLNKCNKILMLERTMRKNFTHGKILNIAQI